MATNGLNSSSTGLKFTTNEITREIIDNSGRHGFGTLSPATLVHISGSTTPVRIEGLASGTDVRVLASDVDGGMLLWQVQELLVQVLLNYPSLRRVLILQEQSHYR
jgi:hypothetical protein